MNEELVAIDVDAAGKEANSSNLVTIMVIRKRAAVRFVC